ncbi:Metallo-dependent hydrolase [Choiromyces venosus 120613-1]|uniref:adenosine deaminase n=1 Tax=Choiromyces venosus 120613-1 TaxID=1336337 RepID=A0A3N4K3L1_9PEZI|nr:Metallo-dependent hydrolase [Choiromyces venosus 120613-1]
MTTSSSTRPEPATIPTASTTKETVSTETITSTTTVTENLSLSACTPNDYEQSREKLLAQDRGVAFDTQAIARATKLERSADKVVKRIREQERADLSLSTPGGRGPSDHFLGNLERINRSLLMKISKQMPKGAHLHCHFNTCLHPSFLIRQAREIKSMFIRSSVALVRPEDFACAAISFAVMSPDTPISDIFDPGYTPLEWALYPEFLERFPSEMVDGVDAESWLANKMVISEQEAHDIHQTTDGIWNRFNQSTQMLKGLFGYESAFRRYVGEAIQSFLDDNVMYAEVRPNFFDKFIMTDNGLEKLDHVAWMRIIREEIAIKMKQLARSGREEDFRGFKVIYCAPRSIKKKDMKWCLDDCMALKRAFPDLICGFDMVGCEDRGNPIKHYLNELLEFRRTCDAAGLDIPFLFHAGETLRHGESTDENLFDAILLGSKRIGHGYGLARHPTLMKICRERGIALEICPISNEILHLCPSIQGHSLPILLTNGVPCTLSSDNPAYFSSTLSHDFYQVMSGFDSMSLHGWRVLAEWSLEHSCMNPQEKSRAFAGWNKKWDAYCQWIVDEFGSNKR